MKRVITAAVLVPLVLLLLLKGSFLLLVAATALVAELATWEYLSIADIHGSRRALVLIGNALLFAATYRNPALILPALGLCALVLILVCSFGSALDRVLMESAFSLFALFYIGLSLVTLPLVWVQSGGPLLLIFLFCVVWTGDVAALYIRRNFGRSSTGRGVWSCPWLRSSPCGDPCRVGIQRAFDTRLVRDAIMIRKSLGGGHGPRRRSSKGEARHPEDRTPRPR
jgi:CDP-diglyceride synthetase